MDNLYTAFWGLMVISFIDNDPIWWWMACVTLLCYALIWVYEYRAMKPYE